MLTQVRTTSIIAHHGNQRSGANNRKEDILYEYVKEYGPLTDRQICRGLFWEINQVTGRRNKCVELGKIIEVGTTICPVTGRRVTLWDTKNKQMRLL